MTSTTKGSLGIAALAAAAYLVAVWEPPKREPKTGPPSDELTEGQEAHREAAPFSGQEEEAKTDRPPLEGRDTEESDTEQPAPGDEGEVAKLPQDSPPTAPRTRPRRPLPLEPTLPSLVEVPRFRVRFKAYSCVTPEVRCTALSQREREECGACADWLEQPFDYEPGLAFDRDAFVHGHGVAEPRASSFIEEVAKQVYGVEYPRTLGGAPVPIEEFVAHRERYDWREVPAEQEPSGTVVVWPDQSLAGLLFRDTGPNGQQRAEVLYPSDRRGGALHRAPLSNLTQSYGPPRHLVPGEIIDRRAAKGGNALKETVAWLEGSVEEDARGYWLGWSGNLAPMGFWEGEARLDASAAMGLSEVAELLKTHPEMVVEVTAYASVEEAAAFGVDADELVAERMAEISSYFAARNAPQDTFVVKGAPPESCAGDPRCIESFRAFKADYQSAAPDRGSLWWSSWVERNGRRVLGPAEVDRAYHLRFLLSPYDLDALRRHSLRSIPISETLAEESDAAEELTLHLLPVLVGQGLELLEGQDRLRGMTIDLKKLAMVPPPPTDAATELLIDWAERVSAETVEIHERLPGAPDDGMIDVQVRTESSGCGGIALSIWDQSLSRPLDFIYQPLPVARECPDLRVSAGPLLSDRIRPLSAGPLRNTAAGLHVFELATGGQVHAIGVLRGEGMAELLSWRLKGEIRNLLRDIEEMATTAHEAAEIDLTNIAHLVKLHIFNAEIPANKVGCQDVSTSGLEAGQTAQRFVECLSECADAKNRPTLYAKLQRSSGEGAFLPISLLQDSEGGFLPARVNLVQPLHRDDVSESSTCIPSHRWKFVFPSAQALGQAELGTFYPPPKTPQRFENQIIETWTDFEALMRKAPGHGEPEAILLMAHHDKQSIRFNDTGPKLPLSGLRSFAPGSAAILAACSVAGVGAQWENDSWTRELRKKQIQTAVITPFQLPFPVGVRFTTMFMNRLAEAYDEGRPATIHELLYETASGLTRDEKVGANGVVAYEFILAGNGDLKICGDDDGDTQ